MTGHSSHPLLAGRVLGILAVLFVAVSASTLEAAPRSKEAKTALERIGTGPGVCVILGLPDGDQGSLVTKIARDSELLVYFQSPDADEISAVRKAAEAAWLLGNRVFVERGDFDRVHLADNLAGAVLVCPSAAQDVKENELVRVLHPQGKAVVGVYAFEAATGRPLWTFRAAPAERRIPVYGNLISTWPVAGGVVVRDGVVYAAAGIAHYDGTYVYALDAASGKVTWYNDTSGATSQKANHGVSLQGSLAIRDGELRFLGGNVHEEARYALATGKCLNEPTDWPRSMFHTAFSAYYPDYGKYVSLDHTLADGKLLSYDATYEGSWHGNQPPRPDLRLVGNRPAPGVFAGGLTDGAEVEQIGPLPITGMQGRRF